MVIGHRRREGNLRPRKAREVSGFKQKPPPEIEVRLETDDGGTFRVRRERVVDVVLIMPDGEECPL